MRKDFKEYYRVLNLSPGATPAEIRRSYHQIVRRWHPDLFKPGSLMQKTAEDITKDTNEAFEQLIKKKHYRKFPPPGEAADPKPPPRPVRRTPPRKPAPARPPRRHILRSLSRLRRWPWRRIAVAACLAGSAFAGFTLRADIRSYFLSPGPVPPAAAPLAARAAERPAGLTAVSVPAAATVGIPPREALLPETPAASLAVVRAPAIADPARSAPRTFEASAAPKVGVLDWNPGTPSRPSILSKRLDEATARLRTFDIGSSKARVLEIQGPPDEDRGSVLRYGSSLVYFSNGWVKGWSDGYPRLNVHRWATLASIPLGRFSLGSGRADVIRAEGMPTGYTASSYTYGTSYVFFENDSVSAFGEGDLRLNSLTSPVLPQIDLNGLP
jgi:hypothetical protein